MVRVAAHEEGVVPRKLFFEWRQTGLGRDGGIAFIVDAGHARGGGEVGVAGLLEDICQGNVGAKANIKVKWRTDSKSRDEMRGLRASVMDVVVLGLMMRMERLAIFAD